MKMYNAEFIKDHTFLLNNKRYSVSVKQQKRLAVISMAKDLKLSLENLGREFKASRKKEPVAQKFEIPFAWRDRWMDKGIIKDTRKKKKNG